MGEEHERMNEVWIAAAGVRFLFTACQKRANFAFGGELCWPRRALVMRLSLIRAVLVAVLAALGAPSAMAQTRPGFWEISIEAAASTGLDSPVAGIILGNAFALAQGSDPNGARPVLTRMHMRPVYIALNKCNLFKSVCDTPDLEPDNTKFDPGLKDYIGSLVALQDSYYDRWQNPHPDDKKELLEALRYAAQHLAEFEVALRRKIASEDAIRLANALAYRGRVFRDLGNKMHAIGDFQEALKLISALRAEIVADREFATGDPLINMGVLEVSTRREDVNEGIYVSADEQPLPWRLMKAANDVATEAIKKGDSSEAEKYIQIMLAAEAADDSDNRLMNRTWTCQESLAIDHLWRAVLNETRMSYEQRFKQDSPDNAVKYFKKADFEYKEALEISLFSHGSASDDFKAMVDDYLDFLKEAGHEEDVERFEATIKAMGDADIGTGGPEEWQNVLNCPQVSR